MFLHFQTIANPVNSFSIKAFTFILLWKADGKYFNLEMVERMRAKGSTMTEKNFIWAMSNPFYCGYIRFPRSSLVVKSELLQGIAVLIKE